MQVHVGLLLNYAVLSVNGRREHTVQWVGFASLPADQPDLGGKWSVRTSRRLHTALIVSVDAKKRLLSWLASQGLLQAELSWSTCSPVFVMSVPNPHAASFM